MFPQKKRWRGGGPNASGTMGPYERQTKAELWCVKQRDKGKLYGPNLVEAGGKVEGDNPEEDPAARPADKVPLTWHSMPVDYYEELMHSYNIFAWWDLTASDPVLPMLCVRKKTSYLGVCYTTEHAAAFEKECVRLIFKAMQDPKDTLYEAELADLINPKPRGASGEASTRDEPQGGGGNDGDTHTTRRNNQAATLLDKLRKLDDGDLGEEDS